MLKKSEIISIFSRWGVYKSSTSLTTLEKEDLLKRLNGSLQTCNRCMLSEKRGRNDILALYRGSPAARVILLGKAPGYNEVRTGILFSGKSGEELNWQLNNANIQPGSYIIINGVNCKLPENRAPKTKEIKACYYWTSLILKIIRPKIIMCMGTSSIYTILRQKLTMNEARGQIFEKDGIKVLATFHPSFISRSTIDVYDRNRQEALKDWKLLKHTMEELGL